MPMPMTIEYEIAIVAQVRVFAVSTRSQMSSTMFTRVLAATIGSYHSSWRMR